MTRYAILLAFCAALLYGCRTVEYVPVQSVRTEYVQADTARFMALINSLKEQVSLKETHSESLIHKEWDKQTVTLNEKGDTIGRDRDHGSYTQLSSEERHEYERLIEAQKDSIAALRQQLASVKADTIRVPYPVEKTVEVERELTKWQQAKMELGGFAFALLFAALCVAVVWLAKKFRK